MDRLLRISLLFLFILFSCKAVEAGKSSPIRTPSTLQFTENKGQWAQGVQYVADLASGKLILQKNELGFLMWDGAAVNEAHHSHAASNINAHLFKIHFANCNPSPDVVSTEKEKTYRNYFKGSDPSHWAGNVMLFKKISYKNLWNGIDANLYGSGDALKYDFRVQPNANVANVQLEYEGVNDLKTAEGEIRYKTTIGEFRELSPYAYQTINGKFQEVNCEYVLNSATQSVSFSFPNGYDKNYELVIDPTLVFSTYTGASADNWGYTATYDNQENMYVGGYVNCDYPSPGMSYPTTPGAFQMTWGGGTGTGQGTGSGIDFACDMGISKFSADGTQLLYSTFIGGNDNETPHSLIVDANDNLIIYGVSYSLNYPVTAGAYDVSQNGLGDIVVTKLNAAGSALIGSTFVGGSGDDGINFDPQEFTSGNLKWNYGDQNRGEVVIDAQNNIYVASCTKSFNFPVTGGAPQSAFGGIQDGCIFKLSANFQTLQYSTFLGGSSDDACYSLDLTTSNEVYVCGGTMSNNFTGTAGTIHPAYQGGLFDGFLAHLNAAGTQFLQSSLIGTNGDDQVYFVKLDGQGDVYFVGQTTGTYPVSNGVYSNPNSGQFIGKVQPDLSSHIYSTVFGNGNGSPNISPTAFLVDTCENVYVAGWGTNSGSFANFSNDMFGMPLTPDALQSSTDGTDFYFFVVNKNAVNLLYGSYFGGNGAIEHVDGGTSRFDKRGVIYEAICAGCGGNSFTPTQPGVWSPNNGSGNCNELGLKIAFNLAGTHVQVDANPRATGCVPLTVQFSSAGSSTQNLQWNFDDGSGSTLANPVHTFTDTGVYRVMLVGSDSSSCNVNDTAYIEVIVKDDSLVANFTPTIDVNCDSNLVTLVSYNYSTTTYFWDLGDGSFSTGDSISHSYPNPGSYTITLVITDTTKCSLMDTFTNSIIILPKLDAVFAMSDSTGCVPLTVNFSVQASATAQYIWNFGDGGTANTSAPSHTYTTANTFQVSMIVIDSSSCNIADTAYATVVTIDSSANADFVFSRVFYGCDSVYIEAWSTYIGEEAELWDFGDGTQSTNDSVSHVYTTAGTYTIMHIITDVDVTCRELDTTRIVISLQPLSISVDIPDLGGCLPFTANFTGNSGLLTTDFFWNFGDSNTATGDSVSHNYNSTGVFNVTVVATDTNACVGADSAFAQITVIDDSVHADFQLNVLNDCDSNLVISLVNQSTNAQEYFWNFGDSTFSTQPDVNHSYNLPNTYIVTLIVTDTSRCHPYDTISQSVTMLPNSFVDFTVANVCLGTTVQFNNLSNPNAQFIWNFDDGNSSNQYSPAHDYTTAGNYLVRLIIVDSTTCDVSDSVTHDVSVYEQPIANFTTEGDTFKFGKPVVFTNTSSFYTHLFWDFGDGTNAIDEETPTHIYESIYNRIVCLIASNDECADTICKTIFISFKGLIGVPNAFTPNADGINDVVRIEGAGIIELVFRIYNRWGEKVFETNDKNVGWDGIYKGELQEMDAYTYAADATLINGEHVMLKGNITLLR